MVGACVCVEGKVSECCMLVDVGKISIISNRGVITQPRDPDPISHHTTPGHRETLEFFQFDIDTVSATIDPKLLFVL